MRSPSHGSLFDMDGAPDRVALRVGAQTLTHAELWGAANAHLEALEEAGLREGDRVAIFTERGLETPVALYAHALGGLVSVPLNPALGERELAHILGDADPKLVLGVSDELLARAAPRPLLRLALAQAPGRARRRDVDDAPLLILYTSGTTGAPKGALLTARNIDACLEGLARAWAWTEEDTVVHALPLFHVHGLVLGLFGALRARGALCWVPRFEPSAIGHALETGGTMLFAVPTMIHRLAEAAEADEALCAALHRARLLVSGSAGLPLREHRRIEALTGRAVIERYGLTETLINTAVRHDAPRPGYVGEPLDGVALRLVDEHRQTLSARDDKTIGEVAVRGPNVFTGYLGKPDATAAVLDDEGWFYTGDLATMSPDGQLKIVGRRSTDLIKTGGYKVGAGEVEAALLEDPSVAEAAVVGVADDDLGERVVAFVVAREGAPALEPNGLIERVARALAPHKRPREVRVVASLPRNAMGKVLKPRLREMLAP